MLNFGRVWFTIYKDSLLNVLIIEACEAALSDMSPPCPPFFNGVYRITYAAQKLGTMEAATQET